MSAFWPRPGSQGSVCWRCSLFSSSHPISPLVQHRIGDGGQGACYNTRHCRGKTNTTYRGVCDRMSEIWTSLLVSIFVHFGTSRHFPQEECSHCTQSLLSFPGLEYSSSSPSPLSSLLELERSMSALLVVRPSAVVRGMVGAPLKSEGGGERPAVHIKKKLNFSVEALASFTFTFPSCSSCKNHYDACGFSDFPPKLTMFASRACPKSKKFRVPVERLDWLL